MLRAENNKTPNYKTHWQTIYVHSHIYQICIYKKTYIICAKIPPQKIYISNRKKYVRMIVYEYLCINMRLIITICSRKLREIFVYRNWTSNTPQNVLELELTFCVECSRSIVVVTAVDRRTDDLCVPKSFVNHLYVNFSQRQILWQLHILLSCSRLWAIYTTTYVYIFTGDEFIFRTFFLGTILLLLLLHLFTQIALNKRWTFFILGI